jgi:hypothetical protein
MGAVLASKDEVGDSWGQLFADNAEWFVKREKCPEEVQLFAMLEKKLADTFARRLRLTGRILAVVLGLGALPGAYMLLSSGNLFDPKVAAFAIGVVTEMVSSVILSFLFFPLRALWQKITATASPR